MLELAPCSDGRVYRSSLASADRLHESSGTKLCITTCCGHVCKFFFTVRHTRHVLQWHRRFWCNCTAPLAATQYITYTASTFAQISYSVLSTPTTLFYQSSLLVFLMCKSLPRSTVWSQYLITLIILIIEPGSYSQFTCIVFHKKFSNWGNLLFHTTATLPTPPWMPCFHVLSSKAFSEFLLSYWSISPSSLHHKAWLFSFLSSYKALFSYLVFYAENAFLHQIKLSIFLSFLQSKCHKI